MRNVYLLNELRKLWNLEGEMVWRMISSAGVGPIVRVYSNINASVYIELLRQHTLPYLRKGTVETPIFMRNNATVLSFLEEEGIAVTKWPSQSLDMTPLENVRKFIGEKVQNRNPQNIDDLWDFLKE